MILENARCLGCGGQLSLEPLMGYCRRYKGEDRYLAAIVTCEANGCDQPHNVVPMPYQSLVAEECGFAIIDDPREPDAIVQEAADQWSEAVLLRCLRLQEGDVRVMVLREGRLSTPTEEDEARGLVESWFAGDDGREARELAEEVFSLA